MRGWLQFVLIACAGLRICSGAQEQSADVSEGLNHFYNLEYDQALTDFGREEAAHPNDSVIRNYIAQTLLYREMFLDGALESEMVSGNNAFLRRAKLEPSPEVQKRFDDEINQVMSISKSRLAKNPDDVHALYDLGVAYALRSNYNFLVRKAWRDALGDATQARKLHDRVIALDPGDYDARLVPGVHEYMVGSLSWTMRALGFLAGFHGDREDGIRKLEEVAKYGKRDRMDAKVILCAIYRRENKWQPAIALLNELIKSFPRNYLLSFEKAQMLAASGNRQEALRTLRGIAAEKQKNAPGYARVAWEKIYYEEGNLEFWFNDLDQALADLKRATAASGGLDLNSGVLAYMREGQIYDLQQRRDLAKKAYEEAIRFAPDSDAAKESKRYIGSPYRRTRT